MVNKSAGMTSNRVIQCLRKTTGLQKMGYLGTLDPIATGVLPVLYRMGHQNHPFYSRSSQGISGGHGFGGENRHPGCDRSDDQYFSSSLPLDRKRIEEVLKEFIGLQEQVPPSFSALKYKGKPLYHWARKGISDCQTAEAYYLLIRLRSWVWKGNGWPLKCFVLPGPISVPCATMLETAWGAVPI